MTSAASEVLNLEPSLRVVISEQLAVRIEQDAVMAVAKGDPDREIRGLQAGARLSACRLAVTLVHQEAHLAPCQHSPLRHSVCVLIPNVQHPVVKVRGSAARQREHHHAYGPLLGTTAQHRAPRIFQIDFHLGQASGEHSAVQQQYSTWAALVLKQIQVSLDEYLQVVQRFEFEQMEGLGETILKILHAVLHVGGLLREDNHRRGCALVAGRALTRRATNILHGKPACGTPDNLRYGRRQRFDLPFVRRFQQAFDRASVGFEEEMLEHYGLHGSDEGSGRVSRRS